MFDTKTIAFRLRWARTELGLKQKELGRRAGISGNYISDIERGNVSNVGVEKVLALAEVLEVSPEWLLGRTDNPLRNMPDEELDELPSPHLLRESRNHLGYELLTLFDQLPPEDQHIILDLARRLSRAQIPHIIGDPT